MKPAKEGGLEPQVLVLTIVPVIAMVVLLWGTARGVGISPDSADYIATAQNLLLGHGFQALPGESANYPPVYPLLLSVAGTIGQSTLAFARVLDSVLFLLCAALLGLTTYITSKKSLLAAVASQLLFTVSFAMNTVFTMAWSEPPFLFFLIISYLLLSLYVRDGGKWILALSSVGAMLAAGTRYAGLCLLPPMLIVLLISGRRTLRSRLFDCLLLLAIVCLPFAGWMLRNAVLLHSSTGRVLAFHPVTLAQVASLCTTLFGFLFPIHLRGVLLIPPLALGLALACVGTWHVIGKRDFQERGDATVTYLTLGAGFAICYIAFLLFSITFADAATPLDERIISPVLMLLTVVLPSVLWNGWATWSVKELRWGYVLLLLVAVSFNGDATFTLLSAGHTEGLGYSQQSWVDSSTVRWVRRSMPQETTYSNGTDVIYVLGGKNSYMLPETAGPTSHVPNRGLQLEMKNLLAEVEDGRALVVYFDHISRWYLPSRASLESEYKFPVLARFDDGVVFGREPQ